MYISEKHSTLLEKKTRRGKKLILDGGYLSEIGHSIERMKDDAPESTLQRQSRPPTPISHFHDTQEEKDENTENKKIPQVRKSCPLSGITPNLPSSNSLNRARYLVMRNFGNQ